MLSGPDCARWANTLVWHAPCPWPVWATPSQRNTTRQLLVTGTGGSGTHTVTIELQRVKLDLGHEALGPDGILETVPLPPCHPHPRLSLSHSRHPHPQSLTLTLSPCHPQPHPLTLTLTLAPSHPLTYRSHSHPPNLFTVTRCRGLALRRPVSIIPMGRGDPKDSLRQSRAAGTMPARHDQLLPIAQARKLSLSCRALPQRPLSSDARRVDAEDHSGCKGRHPSDAYQCEPEERGAGPHGQV